MPRTLATLPRQYRGAGHRGSRRLRVRALTLSGRREGSPRGRSCPETEIAMRDRGSTIVAMHGKIGTLAALTGEAAPREGPSPPHTGSQGGDLDEEGVPTPCVKPTAVPEPVTRHFQAFCFMATMPATPDQPTVHPMMPLALGWPPLDVRYSEVTGGRMEIRGTEPAW